MTQGFKFPLRLAIISGTSLLLSQPLLADFQWNASIDLGAQYEDNMDKLPVDEESDTELLLGADIAITGRGSNYSLDLDYRFLERDYVDDVLDDDTAINGGANFRWSLLRGLDFVLENRIDELRSDLDEADTSDNRQNRSWFSTGFDWNLSLSRVDRLQFAPRYVRVDIEDAEGNDSERASLGISWLRQTSEVSQFSVNVQHQDVEFDDATFDYELQTAYVGYNTELSRLNWGVQLGFSDIERDNFENTDGWNFRGEIAYNGDAQRFGVIWINELTDSVVGFSGEDIDFDDFENNDDNFDEIDVIRRDEFQVFYSRQFNASNDLSLRLSWLTEDFEVLDDDQSRLSFTARYAYSISQKLKLVPELQWTRVTFENESPERENDEARALLTLSYQLSKAIELNLGAGYEERDSSTTPADEYENTLVFFNARYTFR